MRTPSKKSRSSDEKKFAAFDFSEDDERVETASRKMLSKINMKIQKKSAFSSPIDKYKFLQCFSKGAANEQNTTTNQPLYVDDCDDISEERIIRLDASLSSGAKSCVPRSSRFEGSVLDSEDSNHGVPEMLVDIEPVSLDSEDDHSIESKLSSTALDLSRCGGLSEDDHLLEVGCNLCDTEKMVSITPDYIFFQNMYSMEAALAFSSLGIKLEGSTHFKTKKSFTFEWAISEIVSIESIWCESVQLADMSISFKYNDKKVADIANKLSGIMKLNFAVSDSNWSQTEEAIKSLDLRYRATWNTDLDINTLKSEEASVSQNGILCSKHYCPNNSGKVVVYPKGNPDAVSISKREIELLKPETFVNDTIIDFYIKHLENRISPTERRRFHFFNSFFFRKLADLDKDSSSIHEGRVVFQRVRKWTKKVNLFQKDFIFIPVNFSLHWSLIVICHPGEVVNVRDEETEKSCKPSCILHMDSIRGSHRGLKNLFQCYLWEEWKDRHDEAKEDISERFLDLRFIPLELPQQQNSYDCGLFLLHYVELFLEKALVDSNPFNLMLSSSFLQKNWFPPAKASEKRAHIRKLICEIIGDDPREDPMAASDGKYSSHDVSEGNIGIDFLQEKCGATEGYSCCDPNFNPDQEVQITSRIATPMKAMQGSGKSSFVFGDLSRPEKFDSHVPDGNLLQEAPVVNDNLYNILSPIEEEQIFREQSSLPWTEKAECQQDVQIGKPTRSFSKYPVNLEYDPMDSSPGISTSRPSALVEEQNNGDCAVVILVGASPERPSAFVQEQNDEDCVPVILVAPSPEKANYVSDSSSMSNEELAALVIEDSEDEERSNSLDDNANPSLCPAGTFALSLEEVESNDNNDDKETQMQNLLGLDRNQAAWRSRYSGHRKGHLAKGML